MTDLSKLLDEQVVTTVREKDEDAYTEIINRYQGKLFRYAVYITQDDSKAADAVQEAFIKAYVNLNSFDVNRKFSSWIYRITHNETMNVLRKYNNKNAELKESANLNSGINIEDDFVRKELQSHTRECLQELPVIYREPLVLYFLEEKSYEEISDILRIASGTVGTRISRAKILMKNICQRKKN